MRHYKHHEIDFEKWDTCINKAYNSLVYAQSWYLNIVSPGWEALILDDYKAVMPLPRKKKYGIAYLVQPIVTQQLGVFSEQKIGADILQQFVDNIPYKSYCLQLNSENVLEKSRQLPNYELDLKQNYDELFQTFSHNTQRNIAKIEKSNIVITEMFAPHEFLDLYCSTTKNYSEPDKNIVSQLICTGFERKKISLYGAYSGENTLIASLCILHSKNRLIYWLPISNDEGKKTMAMFAIVNSIIRRYARRSIIFDFEGSQIDGVARFYKGFGARLHPYCQIRRLRPRIIFDR
ncbi:MAG: GNAT family N-acetyltransferase [Bacteroidales bacterium]|jgi:hypothetical protein|nr:GNAT family N-acetyltransferase [Bacteroidales bacterium]